MTTTSCASITSAADMKSWALASLLLTSGYTPGAAAAPRRLAIYYGYPSLVQGARGDLERAVATFSDYDVIVFGDGLELGPEAAADPGLQAERQRIGPIVHALHAT